MFHSAEKVLLIGRGPIGTEYKLILDNLGVDCVQVGQDYLDLVRDESLKNKFTHAIIATPVYPMMEIVTNITKIYGNKIQILVEKPFSYDIEKLINIKENAKNVFIALILSNLRN